MPLLLTHSDPRPPSLAKTMHWWGPLRPSDSGPSGVRTARRVRPSSLDSPWLTATSWPSSASLPYTGSPLSASSRPHPRSPGRTLGWGGRSMANGRDRNWSVTGWGRGRLEAPQRLDPRSLWGFIGPEPPRTVEPATTAEATTAACAMDRGQTVLYRCTVDRHPIHIDPDVARVNGFARAVDGEFAVPVLSDDENATTTPAQEGSVFANDVGDARVLKGSVVLDEEAARG